MSRHTARVLIAEASKRRHQPAFHCPEAGWVPWEDFTDPATAGSTVGRGCDQ